MALLKRPLKVKTFLLIGLPLLVGAVVLAISIGSNYQMTSDVLDSAGGTSSGTDYQVTDAVGQPSAVGKSTGTSYAMEAGFVYTLPVSMVRILCGSGLDGPHLVKSFDVYGNRIRQYKPFGPAYNTRGEVHVAGGDIDGDGVDEIAAGHGKGGDSVVKLFEADGTFINRFTAFGPPNTQGEVHLAIGNFDVNLSDKEIAVGQGEGGDSWVKLFKADGTLLRKFRAFGAANAQGEVHLAAADLENADGKYEIVAGMGEGGDSWVKIFSRLGTLIRKFKVFGADNPGGEVHVAVGNFDADADWEIAVATGYNGGNKIKLYEKDGTRIRALIVFGSGPNPNGEVQIAAADIDGDGTWEIICAQGEGGSSLVKLYEADGTLIRKFTAFGPPNTKGEVHLATIE